jgi:hypothetical protein
MAVKLIANYSKRLGLPGYSSHQFSVSVETELVDIGDVPGESRRLYELLQTNVDGQIQSTGFVPPATYGMDDPSPLAAVPAPGGPGANAGNGNGANGSGGCPLDGRWKCSEKQRDLILKLVGEHDLDKNEIEALAVERFGKGVRLLGKLEASGLIDELFESYCGRNGRNGRNGGGGSGRRGYSRNAYAGNRNGGAR